MRQANAIFDRLVTEHPDVDEYFHHRAYSYYMLGNAVLHLGRATEAEEAMIEAANQYEAAIANRAYNEAYFLELPPIYEVLVDVQNGLGKAEDAQRSADRLLALVDKIPSFAENNGSIYIHIGTALKDVGRPNEAVRILRDLLRRQPNNATANANFGRLLIAAGNLAEGIPAADKAFELGSHDAMLLNNLAWAFATTPDRQFRNPTRAVELAAQAVELAPSNRDFGTR